MKKIPQPFDAPDEAPDEAADGATGSAASLAPPPEAPPEAPPKTPARGSAGARPGGAPARPPPVKRIGRAQGRRHARERTLQALYQWDLAGAESSTVRREFLERQDMSRVDVAYFERLFRGVSLDVGRVDEALGEALDRPLAEVDPIERAVLRMAAFELAEVPETPARVVINEGVEITKRFGADSGHRYVNGVLDRLAGVLRPREMGRG